MCVKCLYSGSKVEVDYINGQVTCLSRLRQIRELLLLEQEPSPYRVQELLGHGVLAGMMNNMKPLSL